MKSIKYLLEAIIIYLFFLIIKLIGLNFSRKIFASVFNYIGPIIKSKKTIKQNLKKINPNLSEDEEKKIIKKMWNNYGMTFVEYIYLNKFRNTNLHINIEGKEILKKIILNNKPVIFISGHFANFELMSMELTKNKINLATIYRPLNNYFLNPFMEYLRKKYICRNQIKKGIPGMKYLIEDLKNNRSIALMVDQRVSEGETINFFDHPSLTTTLPAQIAIKYNCDIVPIYISRNSNNNFNMKIYQPIEINDFKNRKKSKIEITKKLNDITASMISKDPSQWILTHNRWK
tara:strand:- start:1792 stop:2658 length:867 start_codon:yes stop_codon:yes gene_type:complete